MRGPTPKPFECPELIFWYLVGLVATDGCLLSNRRTVVITSKDKEFLVALARRLGLPPNIRTKRSGFGAIGHDLVIGRKVLYERLQLIGLTPRKTATIGPLNVPDAYFKDFFRGAIDGDGSIRYWHHPSNGREQWSLRLFGISSPFLVWIRETVDRLWGVRGQLYSETVSQPNRRPKHTLKFGKLATKAIVTSCYYPGAFALERKKRLADLCAARPVGWKKSKTVDDSTRWNAWQYVHIWSRGPVVREVSTAYSSSGHSAYDRNSFAGVMEWQTSVT